MTLLISYAQHYTVCPRSQNEYIVRRFGYYCYCKSAQVKKKQQPRWDSCNEVIRLNANNLVVENKKLTDQANRKCTYFYHSMLSSVALQSLVIHLHQFWALFSLFLASLCFHCIVLQKHIRYELAFHDFPLRHSTHSDKHHEHMFIVLVSVFMLHLLFISSLLCFPDCVHLFLVSPWLVCLFIPLHVPLCLCQVLFLLQEHIRCELV